MGCDPSQFQGVASSDLVENVETVVHCSVFSDKGCEGMYGGETICPYDDVFVGVVQCSTGNGFLTGTGNGNGNGKKCRERE